VFKFLKTSLFILLAGIALVFLPKALVEKIKRRKVLNQWLRVIDKDVCTPPHF